MDGLPSFFLRLDMSLIKDVVCEEFELVWGFKVGGEVFYESLGVVIEGVDGWLFWCGG